MSLPRFDYVAPRTLDEACGLLDEIGAGARLMAGGTDVLLKVKHGTEPPAAVIGLRRVEELDHLSFDHDGGLRIGAMARLTDIATHADVQRHYPAMVDAALQTATLQIRNMATLVGNACNASPCADNVQVPLALGAEIHLRSPAGERVVPFDDFFTGPGETALRDGEIATEVRVPKPAEGQGVAYLNISARSRVDITAAGVAVALTMQGERCEAARIVLGGVAATPQRPIDAEAILHGDTLSDAVVEKAAESAANACKPISDVRATAGWRRKMVAVLTARAIRAAAERARP